MSFRATVLNVMLASPSDVSHERRIARDVLHEWNVVHAADRKIVLLPVGWETHSFPEMGDRPQALINRRLLAKCDLLLAIFWTRLGSPTGEAPSGTVEEIEEHLKKGRPALIYFSTAPVRPESVDAAQYSAVQRFKAALRAKGLVEEYDDLSLFREKLRRHLVQTVIEQAEGAAPLQPPGSASRRRIPSLSPAAKELLLVATEDPVGVVRRFRSLGKVHIQTYEHEFITEREGRQKTKWHGALDELEREGLLEDRTGTGEVLSVTNYGYVVADELGVA